MAKNSLTHIATQMKALCRQMPDKWQYHKVSRSLQIGLCFYDGKYRLFAEGTNVNPSTRDIEKIGRSFGQVGLEWKKDGPFCY